MHVPVAPFIHRVGQTRVHEHIKMREFRAFRLAGRPRGVENHGRVGRFGLDGRKFRRMTRENFGERFGFGEGRSGLRV
jgi:hypothetical protein